MPNCTQVAGAVKEQVITGAGKKGFFRRIAERMGLAQREVAECRGKSLREMAEMTSRKDTVELKTLSKMEESINNAMSITDKAINDRYIELQEIRYKLNQCKKAKNGEYDKQIELLRERIKEEEKLIRAEQPNKGNSGYSPDADHVYGEISAESDAHFERRIAKMRKEKLEPLEKELHELESYKYGNEYVFSLTERESKLESEIKQLKAQYKNLQETHIQNLNKLYT